MTPEGKYTVSIDSKEVRARGGSRSPPQRRRAPIRARRGACGAAQVQSGELREDWDFLPPKKIKDPAFSKPSDWVDETMMDDPEDKKPEGWDDIPKQIADPEATQVSPPSPLPDGPYNSGRRPPGRGLAKAA